MVKKGKIEIIETKMVKKIKSERKINIKHCKENKHQ